MVEISFVLNFVAACYCTNNHLFFTYLISRFLFIIKQTRVFPTMSTTTSMKSTVIMTTSPDSDMMGEC